MDSVDHIEGLIRTGAEGFFDEPEIRKDLRVTIGIARDFHAFLLKFGQRPPAKEIDYIMGTIRSGIDEFFALAYVCGAINTDNKTWSFEPHVHWDFPGLRETFIRGFERLAGSEASPVDRLASLFVLTHLELVFLARHFPSAILEDEAND